MPVLAVPSQVHPKPLSAWLDAGFDSYQRQSAERATKTGAGPSSSPQPLHCISPCLAWPGNQSLPPIHSHFPLNQENVLMGWPRRTARLLPEKVVSWSGGPTQQVPSPPYWFVSELRWSTQAAQHPSYGTGWTTRSTQGKIYQKP